MPILNDLKKMFFGAKSVAKHQGEKAGKLAKDVGDELAYQAKELADRSPEYMDRGRKALNDLGDRVFKDEEKPKRDDLSFGKLNLTKEEEAPKSGAIDFEEELIEKDPAKNEDPASAASPDEPSALQQVRDSTLDSAARAGLKAKEASARAGDELLNRAAQAGDKLKDRADAFIDHANQEAEKMRREEETEKAEREAAIAKARERAFKDTEGNRGSDESTLEGSDSFFDRADRFAQGDYTDEGGKPVRILENPDTSQTPEGGSVTGFTDEDNDGDALIDDAILDDETPPRK